MQNRLVMVIAGSIASLFLLQCSEETTTSESEGTESGAPFEEDGSGGANVGFPSVDGGGEKDSASEDVVCVPSCEDKECGDDGCGGFCSDRNGGACPEGGKCSPEGKCEACEPICEGKDCGDDDGCGGSCECCDPEEGAPCGCHGKMGCDGTCEDEKPLNECDECGDLPSEYGESCGCNGTVGCESTCEGEASLNACDECGDLPSEYGEICGCNGTVGCDGTCEGETSLNACGQCGDVPLDYGKACGCGGVIGCSGGCEGGESTNSCGGCDVLPAEPEEGCCGDPAGDWTGGTWECEGTDLVCVDILGQCNLGYQCWSPGLDTCDWCNSPTCNSDGSCGDPDAWCADCLPCNACGGPDVLPAAPGEACCGDPSAGQWSGGNWECEGTDLVCVDALGQCNLGYECWSPGLGECNWCNSPTCNPDGSCGEPDAWCVDCIPCL